MEGITFEEVLKLNNPIIVDIRDNYSYCLGHINRAINIPYYNLLNNYSRYLDKNKVYYLYCDYGTRSEKACETLSNKGYHVINVQGGYNEYKLLMHKK